ncbi:hypothetical protein C0Q70_12569 [Pomacea canaliculata]|uniref:Ig-like domain-containing protein n=1 Tax=Pomacea canaliculata TaxID=400727 RepID=A0A2T7P1W7_POMCA|nr:hypothetical protein C0Q70_12569 [Pomacea canaliculata]
MPRPETLVRQCSRHDVPRAVELLVVLLLCCRVAGGDKNRTSQSSSHGLTSGAFRREQSIREVVCTCEQLSPDIDVLFMMVYQVPSSRVLASFSYYKRECWNSDYFVSCVIDEADSRMSRLAILVADLPEGSSRAYGCNVSTMAPGGVLRVLSWRVDVVHPWSKLRSPCSE